MPRGGSKPGERRIKAATAAAAALKRAATAAKVASGYLDCLDCKASLPLEAFGSDASSPTGYSRRCRECSAAYWRDRRASAKPSDAERARDRKRKARARRHVAWFKLAAEMARPEREPQQARWRIALACCGGEFRDDPASGWWRAFHEAGCRSRWQPTEAPPTRAEGESARLRVRAELDRDPGRSLDEIADAAGTSRYLVNRIKVGLARTRYSASNSGVLFPVPVQGQIIARRSQLTELAPG